jgi:hypothetical protein
VLWIVIAIVVIGVVVAVIQAKELEKDIAATRQRLCSKFNCDDLYVTSSRPVKCLGVVFKDSKIILAAGTAILPYDFSRITAIEVVENGATVTHTNRGSQLLGAVAGGALLGGVGALIGGLSGSSRSLSRVRSLSLKITIDDRVNPVWLISFFNDPSEKGSDPGSSLVTKERAKLERMYAHVRNAIRQSQATQPTVTPTVFSADELRKLWDLKQSGILTENEYEQQKARLLGTDGQVAIATSNHSMIESNNGSEHALE